MRCIRRPFFVTALSVCILITIIFLSSNFMRGNLHHADVVEHHQDDIVGRHQDDVALRNMAVIQPNNKENSNARKVQPTQTGSGWGSAKPSSGSSVSGKNMDGPLLRILVLTFNRGRSLLRCLDSLNNAVYGGYRQVELEIHIDRAKDGSVHNETVTIAQGFRFRHGQVTVNVHPDHVGVVGQWLRTWHVPSDNSTREIAVFVEDDISLSPYFARWLKRMHDKYDSYPHICGYTLQGESIRHAVGSKSSLLSGPPGQLVFLYQVMGSWGFSPNLEQWRKFISWYNEVSTKKPVMIPHVPGLVPSIWYQELRRTGRGDTMWTMWHIYHSFQNKLYTVYTNFPNKKAFAFNWKEAGLHYHKAAMGKGLTSNLVDTWREEDVHLPDKLVILNTKGDVTGEKLSPSGIVH